MTKEEKTCAGVPKNLFHDRWAGPDWYRDNMSEEYGTILANSKR